MRPSPLINAAIFLQVSSTQRSRASMLAHAICGVSCSFPVSFSVARGLSARIGSFSNTSVPAPLISPFHQRLIQRIRIHNRTPRHIDQHCALFSFWKKRPHSSGETFCHSAGSAATKYLTVPARYPNPPFHSPCSRCVLMLQKITLQPSASAAFATRLPIFPIPAMPQIFPSSSYQGLKWANRGCDASAAGFT